MAAQEDPGLHLKGLFRTAAIVNSAFAFTIALLPAVAYVVTMDAPREPHSQPVIVAAFGVVSIASALAAVLLVPLLVPLHATESTRIVPERTVAGSLLIGRLYTRALIGAALSEIPGILGFILFFMTADWITYLAFIGMGLIACVFTFPRWSAWQQALAEAYTAAAGL